jgi:hypothetical protein
MPPPPPSPMWIIIIQAARREAVRCGAASAAAATRLHERLLHWRLRVVEGLLTQNARRQALVQVHCAHVARHPRRRRRPGWPQT